VKLIAKIERRLDGYKVPGPFPKDAWGRRSLRCTFPKGSKWPCMLESVLERNIGPRPYAEASMVNDNGERVVVYYGERCF
jgi:hypothetical protein